MTRVKTIYRTTSGEEFDNFNTAILKQNKINRIEKHVSLCVDDFVERGNVPSFNWEVEDNYFYTSKCLFEGDSSLEEQYIKIRFYYRHNDYNNLEFVVKLEKDREDEFGNYYCAERYFDSIEDIIKECNNDFDEYDANKIDKSILSKFNLLKEEFDNFLGEISNFASQDLYQSEKDKKFISSTAFEFLKNKLKTF